MQILKFALREVHIFSIFRYQHVGIGNAKLWHLGSKPTPVPNAYGFTSQWNIGLTVFSKNKSGLKIPRHSQLVYIA